MSLKDKNVSWLKNKQYKKQASQLKTALTETAIEEIAHTCSIR